MQIFKDIKESIVNKFQDVFTNYTKSKIWKEYLLGPTFAHCIIYSNDGLMFKTDSHYNRFIAIE